MNDYQPTPIDTVKVSLPVEVNDLTEQLAKNAHDIWAQARMNEGWSYGPNRNDSKKENPCLIPYSNLPDSEKHYDRDTVMETLKAIYALGYRVVKGDGTLQRRHFISYARKDKAFVDTFRARLEANNLITWYDQRNIDDLGEWEKQIRDGLSQSDVFILMVSQDSLDSTWVRREVEWALGEYKNRFEGRIMPVLIDSTLSKTWFDVYDQSNEGEKRDPGMGKMGIYQAYPLYNSNVAEMENQYDTLLRALGVKYPPKLERYGDVLVPVYLYVGGDGITRYGNKGDIIAELDNDSHYQVPEDLKAFFEQDGFILRKELEAKQKGQNFTNGDQIRLNSAIWGSAETMENAGEENRPLRLYLGWTKYFSTHMTNFATNTVINTNTKETVERRLYTPIEEFTSQYSDPFTTNLSVVTSDGYIYLKTRSKHCAGNVGKAGGFSVQPAVSGSGSPKDVDENKKYDPFRTALREAREEILGIHIPDDQIEITFFGLARIWRTRFPFLFGEARLKNVTHVELENQRLETAWEGSPIRIKFTIEDVTDWIRTNYFKYPESRYATTYFSLIQSLIYEYPDRINDICNRLLLHRS